MEYIMFFYNILIVVSLSVGGFGFFRVYRKSGQKYALWFALLFLVLWINNFITFMAGFLTSFIALYKLNAAFIDFFLFTMAFVLLLCFRMSLGYLLDFPPKKRAGFLWAVLFLLLSLVSAVHVPAYNLAVSVFIYLSELGLFLYSFYRLFLLRSKAPPVEVNSFLFLLSCTTLVLLIDLAQLIHGVIQSQLLIHERTLPSEILCAVYIAFSFAYLWAELGKGAGSGIHLTYGYDETLVARFAKKHGLTTREQQVLGLLLEGHSNLEISQQLFIAEGTVKVHAHNIYQKLNISQRIQLNKAVSEFAQAESAKPEI